jgi:hypothetical protein
MRQYRHYPKKLFIQIALLLVLLLGIGGAGTHFLTRSEAATPCTVSDKLVNSCRPWLGASAGKYPQAASSIRSQIEYHEKRIGRKLDIVHTYHPVGSNTLSTDDKYFATRASTYLFTNWKPASDWSLAGGSNSGVNAGIDQMAASVKSLGSTKIFMTLHHEAENDVSGGAVGCAANIYKGNYGTPAEYHAMWKNVQDRFAARGVTNVVWVWDLINYEPWDCLIDDMYPGNTRVDWIMFNAYGGPSQPNYSANIRHFYDLLATTNSTSHNYLSKPWGIVEWNSRNSSESVGSAYYSKAKVSLDTEEFPRLKAFMIFDNVGPEGNENRVAYTDTGVYSQVKQDAYNAFAQSPRFTDAYYVNKPPADTTPPTATVTISPTTVKPNSSVTAKVGASDNVGVTKVEVYSDGVLKGTDSTAPYEVTWTTVSSEGNRPVTAKVYDAAGNITTSGSVTLTVSAQSIPTAPGDVNGDGKVNTLDYSLLVSHDGQNYPPADFNKDGTVDAGDLAVLLSRWTW